MSRANGKPNGKLVRLEGEPAKIHYNEKVHPIIIRRMVFYGYDHADIANALGITEATLDRWFARYEDLQMARVEAQMKGPSLVEVAYRMAMGEYDPETGQYAGGSESMVKFLLERKHGFHKPNEKEVKAQEDVDANLRRVVERVERMAGGPPRLRALAQALEDGGERPE